MKQFEDMTIGELRKQTDQFKIQNSSVQTAEELLEKKVEVNDVEWCSNCEINYPKGQHDEEMCKYINR